MKQSPRVKMLPKIDVHAHYLPEDLPSFKEKFGYSGWVRLEKLNDYDSNGLRKAVLLHDDDSVFRKVNEKLYSYEARLKNMKQHGVTRQIISTVPVTFNYWAKSEDNEVVCRYLNDHLSAECQRYPDKFSGLGTVPLQNVDLACKELIRCKTELKLNGIIIGTHVNEHPFHDSMFEPFWKTAQDFDMPLLIHPWSVTKANGRWCPFWLSYIVGMAAETTAAALSMAYSGVLERHRQLRIILSHGGGALPYLSGRANQALIQYPQDMQKCVVKCPDEYLKMSPNVCADTMVYKTETLNFALDYYGQDSMMCGSDYPFPLGVEDPGSIVDQSNLSSCIKKKLLYENATRFFNL